MKTLTSTALLAAGLAFASGAALADKPSADVKPLSEIALKLEQTGHGRIPQIGFDDAHCEVNAHRDGKKREVPVDPRTGKVTKDGADD